MAPGATDDIRSRLRRALPAAIKARDLPAVAALRSALAAIDNAEAVDITRTPSPMKAPPASSRTATAADSGVPPGGRVAGEPPDPGPDRDSGRVPGAGPDPSPVAGALVGVGAGEMERRRLTGEEMEAIVRGEVVDRRAAARSYEDAGEAGRAQRLREEADVLGGYLREPDRPA